ncbi:MAG: aminotransferase class IV [Bacteroidales bacterium]|nr:aminotransferase class IV [Bacteroidales bacterium]
MHESKFICYNGEYLHAGEPLLHAGNRAFRFHDTVSEDMHAYGTEPQFLDWHVERLLSNMQLLSMEIPVHYNAEVFRTCIIKLLMKNRIFGGAAVHLAVFRDSPGSLIPEQNHVSFVLDCHKLENNFYELNTQGYVIDVYRQTIRFRNRFSSLWNASAQLFIMAGIHNRQNGLDACVLINEKGGIVESADSNIFLVKDSSVLTPGIGEGCIPGIIRRAMIEICGKAGFRVNDQCMLPIQALEDADEVFMTNAINGIRWTGAYKQKRYYKKAAQLLLKQLNEFAFNLQGSAR